MIEFFVPGPPVPQPRPRVYRGATGGVRTVSNTGKVKAYKQVVALCARVACGPVPFPDPVQVSLLFLMARPKRLRGKDREWHWCTPDIDNMIKSTLDALKGICWVDDGQVCRLLARKQYAAKGEPCGVRVCLVTAD